MEIEECEMTFGIYDDETRKQVVLRFSKVAEIVRCRRGHDSSESIKSTLFA